MQLIDTHVHLDDTRYDPDREALIERARAAGVGILVTIGTHLEDSRWNVAFVAGKQDVYATVGIHPEMADRWQAADLAEYEALAQKPGVVAIGEVGMDYHRPEFSRQQQEPVFRAMIALAKKLKLPLVIHNRQADRDTLEILRQDWDPSLGGIFHCFAGDAQCAREAVDLNFDLAVGGVLTFKSAQGLRDIIATVPLDRIVLETDGPWLAPQAWRGQRNEPAYVASVAQTLATVKGVSVEEAAEATTRNARRVFRLKD
jgi:TatD DNase family protein